jgi:hypothetical protein
MCRTVHAVLQTAICGIQMLVRVFMTIILMIENVIRMLLQTLYNFISFLLQMVSLIPICVVFLLTARLKCFMCGGGGPCPVARGGTCDCLMSGLAFVILFFIFRATGVLDKIFYSLGYTKARPVVQAKFVPTPGDITECSRNDTESTEPKIETIVTTTEVKLYYDWEYEDTTTDAYYWYYYPRGRDEPMGARGRGRGKIKGRRRKGKPKGVTKTLTTILYYLV